MMPSCPSALRRLRAPSAASRVPYGPTRTRQTVPRADAYCSVYAGWPAFLSRFTRAFAPLSSENAASCTLKAPLADFDALLASGAAGAVGVLVAGAAGLTGGDEADVSVAGPLSFAGGDVAGALSFTGGDESGGTMVGFGGAAGGAGEASALAALDDAAPSFAGDADSAGFAAGSGLIGVGGASALRLF